MDISYVNIKIIDTTENELPLIVEFTQRGSPQLIYNGGSDRFGTLVPSELHFNMLVEDASDAKFLHLFTGNETRYKVILEDYSDPGNAYTFWTGFLLPEQFGEPWKGGGFFVDFIATDGIGRIKNAKLADSFYGQITGISVVIAECLKLTGLTFPIFIAPGIINAVQDLKYSQIAVDTTSYEGTKNKNPYEILDDILLSIGCKLFQWKEVWYVVGINRFTETTIEFEEYDSDGVYVQQTEVVREVTPITFYQNPRISIQSPFKNITITWDKDQDESILPVDIIYQPSEEPINWNDYLPISNWLVSTANFETGLSSYKKYLNILFVSGGYLYQPSITPLPNEDPFYVSLFYTHTGGEDADVNYISLDPPIYLEAAAGDDKYLTLDIEFYFLSYTDISTAFLAGDYEYAFIYELIYDAEVLVSNKSTFTDYEAYNFEMEQPTPSKIKGTLNIKKIPLSSNGTLDIKLSGPLNALSGERLVFTKLEITYNSEDETFEKIRDIEFTTTEVLDVFHSDDQMDITNRQWLFTDDVVVNINIDNPALTQEFTIIDKVLIDTPFYSIGYVKWYISYEDFLIIQANPLALYIQFESDSSYSNYILPGLDGQAPISQDAGGYFVWEVYAGPGYAGGAIWLFDNNKIWILVAESTENITDTHYLREKWRRYEIDETIRYIDALARIYHDTVNEAAFKVSGDVLGFINPLELGSFFFIEGKTFVITNNTIKFGQGNAATTVELVEATKYNVTDYVN